MDLAAERSIMRTQRSTGCLATLCADEPHHRFCLRKIHFAVQKGPACKFTCGCRACTRLKNRTQRLLKQKEATVAGEFYHILTRVAVRRSKNQSDGFIDRSTFMENSAKMRTVAFGLRQRQPARRLKHRIGDLQRFWP